MPLPLLGLAGLAIEAVPTIARWIGGEDAEKVTKQVTDVALAVTGMSTTEDAEKALRANPEAYATFQISMREIDNTETALFMKDRADARARDGKFIDNGMTNWRANVMLIAAFVAVIAIAAILGFGQVAAGGAVAGFLITIGGMFARNIGSAFDFEFGSSRGSKEKTNALQVMTRKANKY